MENTMIRFYLGFTTMLIGVSTMDSSVSIINHGITLCVIGLALMAWAVPTLQQKYGDDE